MTFYGISSLIAFLLVNLGCGDKRYFRWAGVAAATAGLILALVDIWDRLSYSSVYSRKSSPSSSPPSSWPTSTSSSWLAFAPRSGGSCGPSHPFHLLGPRRHGRHPPARSRGAPGDDLPRQCRRRHRLRLRKPRPHRPGRPQPQVRRRRLRSGSPRGHRAGIDLPACRLHQTVPFGNSIFAPMRAGILHQGHRTPMPRLRVPPLSPRQPQLPGVRRPRAHRKANGRTRPRCSSRCGRPTLISTAPLKCPAMRLATVPPWITMRGKMGGLPARCIGRMVL